jgi:AhpD family alkylhydroperoxidase
MLAALSALSPLMAVGITHSERAVIAVVVMLAARIGGCVACHEEIAARAGVSVSTVKRALAKMRKKELLDRRERRRPGRPNLTNVVKISNRELRERTQRRIDWRGRSPKKNVLGPAGLKKEGRAMKGTGNDRSSPQRQVDPRGGDG